MRRIKIVAASALAIGLLVIGAAGTVVVMAQGPTPTAPPSVTTPTAPPTPVPGTQTPTARTTLMQLFWQSLANKLGLSVATVQQDVIDAAKDAINQAVKQGLMSQAQANNLLNRLQNIKPGQNFGLPGFTNRRFYANPPARRNVPPYGNPRGLPNSRYFGPGQGFMFDHAGGLMNLDVLEAVAKALNMNAADVTNALASGKTLADLAKSQNVNASAVQSAIVNAISANLDRAVKDGLMTQAQANALKSRLNPNNINLNQRGLGLGGPAFGPGMMMPYNRGMIPNGRGMMPNNPGTNRNGRGQFRWY